MSEAREILGAMRRLVNGPRYLIEVRSSSHEFEVGELVVPLDPEADLNSSTPVEMINIQAERGYVNPFDLSWASPVA